VETLLFLEGPPPDKSASIERGGRSITGFRIDIGVEGGGPLMSGAEALRPLDGSPAAFAWALALGVLSRLGFREVGVMGPASEKPPE